MTKAGAKDAANFEPVQTTAAQAAPEPWMRGTHRDLDALRRAVMHALELAGEDVERWCAGLADEPMHARPGGAASVAFHLRHMARSLDRLLSYAEGRELTEEQLLRLRSEDEPSDAESVLAEWRRGLESAMARVRAFSPAVYEEARSVGRKRLPTTVGGLLVHAAEHTSRHAGQAVTTAKVVQSRR